MLYELTLPASSSTSQHHHHQQIQTATSCNPTRISPVQQKDYSRPLHVDCSVEYELPSQVKPPPPPPNGKIDPLLMIHPCYFRKIEAQRRSPFINNLPTRAGGGATSTIASTNVPTTTAIPNNNARTNTNNRIISGQSHLLGQTNSQHAVSCRNVATNNNMKIQQTIPQQQYSHYQIPNNVNRQQQWSIEQQCNQHYNKQTTSTVGSCKQQSTVHHHQLPSCAGPPDNGIYNVPNMEAAGGLWTNTNHSPLAAERFPESQLSTLHPHQQIPPTVTATDHNNIVTSSCSKNQQIMSGKYRQYLRTHRLHPYMSMTSSAFPQFTQMQQISCYNV